MAQSKMQSVRQPTLWGQVWSLAAVQGVMSLTWLFYGLYLPGLLTQLSLSPDLGRLLLILENLLAVAVEPIMGSLSDRAQYWVGTRLPMITIGVIAAASLFIAMPALVLFGQPSPIVQACFLAITIAWALAMAAFRSPVLCLLGKYATVPNLPQAASVLTLVGGLVGALRPLASDFILGLGAAVTFAIASISLLGATAVLRMVYPVTLVVPESTLNLEPEPLLSPQSRSHQARDRYLSWLGLRLRSLPKLSLTMIFIIGLGNAWGIRLLLADIMPKLWTIGMPTSPLPLLMGVTSILLGLVAIPMGLVATYLGNRPWMLINLLVVIITLGMTIVAKPPILATMAILLLIAATSVILNGVIPLVLAITSSSHSGLGIGVYFSGFTAGMALLSVIIANTKDLAFAHLALITMGAFALSYLGLWATRRQPSPVSV